MNAYERLRRRGVVLPEDGEPMVRPENGTGHPIRFSDALRCVDFLDLIDDCAESAALDTPR